MKPPDEDKWEEMGLYDRCTCKEYDWKEICPYTYEIFDEEYECECCPCCSYQCALQI